MKEIDDNLKKKLGGICRGCFGDFALGALQGFAAGFYVAWVFRILLGALQYRWQRDLHLHDEHEASSTRHNETAQR